MRRQRDERRTCGGGMDGSRSSIKKQRAEAGWLTPVCFDVIVKIYCIPLL